MSHRVRNHVMSNISNLVPNMSIICSNLSSVLGVGVKYDGNVNSVTSVPLMKCWTEIVNK